MRAFLAAAMLVVLVPSSAHAASIVYEHPFTLADYFVAPGIEHPEELQLHQYFPLLETDWVVPAFDPALGEPIVLFLDLLTTTERVEFTVDPPETAMLTVLNLLNFANGEAFNYSAHIFPVEGFPVDWTQPIHWVIQTHADSFAFYDLRASATFDILIEGTARATYLYEPAVVPEPTTMLLLGSGLIGAEWKRRRRHC